MASLTPHAPIQIFGNGNFTKANGVVRGTGTRSNPYLIENWNITYSSTVGIWVESTTAYFIIQNVEVCCGSSATGIVLTNVSNGAIASSTVTSTNLNGIDLDSDTTVSVTGGAVTTTNTDTAAIETSLSAGVNVSGVSLSSAGWGVAASDVNGLDLWNDVPGGPLATGINVSASQGVRIFSTNASAHRSGIELWRVTGALLQNDAAYTSAGLAPQQSALRIVGSSWVNVSRCRFGALSAVPGSGPAAHIEGSHVSLSGSTLTSSGSAAVAIEGAQSVALIGNMFGGNASGLLLDRSRGVDLEGNALAAHGLVLRGALPTDFDTHTIAANNTVGGKAIVYARNCAGVSLDGIVVGQVIAANCTGLRIANVSVSGVDFGIQVFDTQSLTLTRVNVSSCGYDGLLLRWVSNAQVTDSRFESNGFAATPVGVSSAIWGLEASDSTNGTIARNMFLRNQGGLYLNLSKYYLIEHNTFSNNPEPAWQNSGPNYWNASYPTGGNSWSDYRGWDDCHGPLQDNCTNGDGIGDFPYAFSTTGIDHYPLLAVNPPKVPPVAVPQVVTASPIAGEPVLFIDASYDPTGWPLESYSWDFGDGSTSTDGSPTVSHTYQMARSFTVTLMVTSKRGLSDTASVPVIVAPPPTIPLTNYISPRGYTVPVPAEWSRTYNVTSGNYTYELYLQGTAGGLPANMLVDTEPVSDARETNAYLTSAVVQIFQGVQKELPDAYLKGVIYILPLSGHLAATFEIGYTARTVIQFALILVSEAHEREWSVILTGATASEAILNATFVEVVQGVSITAAPPSSPPPSGPSSGISASAEILSLAIAITIPAVLVAAYWVRRRRRTRTATASPPSHFFCTQCGATLVPGQAFCGRCGVPVLISMPPPPTQSPPKGER